MESALRIVRWAATVGASDLDLVADTLSRLENMRDRSDYQHEQRVSAIAGAIAHLLGLEDAHAAAIRRAARLHDIGKLVLPDAVLHKASMLSSPEGEMIKMHTKLGHELLYNEEHPDLKLAATIALHHHEHADGTGYPARLVGKDIPIEARIVTMADVYSALREARAYKQPMAHEKALKIISIGDGRLKSTYFDTDILQVVIAAPNEIAAAYAPTKSRASVIPRPSRQAFISMLGWFKDKQARHAPRL